MYSMNKPYLNYIKEREMSTHSTVEHAGHTVHSTVMQQRGSTYQRQRCAFDWCVSSSAFAMAHTVAAAVHYPMHAPSDSTPMTC